MVKDPNKIKKIVKLITEEVSGCRKQYIISRLGYILGSFYFFPINTKGCI